MYSKSSSPPRFTLPPLNNSLQGDYYQKSTFSYSYPEVEYYHPVYNKHEWSEAEPVVLESQKLKKKREMDDRITEIDREFLENRQVLYDEKMKQLQQELSAVEKGNHETFDISMADLDEKRRETIQDAKLMMIYQISSVDKQYHNNWKKLHDESLAEQKQIQNALFTMIEEKRRKLKQDKDGEGELLNLPQQHQTRNRKRLQRKRGDLENVVNSSPPIKKKLERQKESPSHLLGVLSHRVEGDIEADFYAMRKKSV